MTAKHEYRMELILWRHAEAHDGTPDLARELTHKGKKQAEKMAAFLRTRLPETARILVSPALRAQQTARALSKKFLTEPAVGTDATVDSVLQAVGWPNAKGTVVVVGHQPVLGQIAAFLLAGTDSGFSIKKGAVWWLGWRHRGGVGQVYLRLAIAPDSLIEKGSNHV